MLECLKLMCFSVLSIIESHSKLVYMQENNKVELERLEREKHSDFLKMLKGFVNDQVVFLPFKY